ncbi:zf-TFIIB domain-containing protein [Sphingomonas daechungensis]|uniref:Zf-TFIIB domain-containing protein n=1 Tax=Sphingomonas daechungensis TaxID=1176646 RepID=A0ABX6T1V5_9SPHN|nr:zf-TFIIB domain-containing protein [Sphingomonas daechungensis]QNP43735.1 zf-TFIIB domain-containing protein [Sphingomonas daechungensis]
MQCPVCATQLTMSERQGIEIDYCPSCRGVWLDRGELDKIIQRSGAASDAPPQAVVPYGHDRHWDDDRYQGRRHGKRRKSFLEELFD